MYFHVLWREKLCGIEGFGLKNVFIYLFFHHLKYTVVHVSVWLAVMDLKEPQAFTVSTPKRP